MKFVRAILLFVATLYFLLFAFNIRESGYSSEHGFYANGYQGDSRFGPLLFSLFCLTCYLGLRIGGKYYREYKASHPAAMDSMKKPSDSGAISKPPVLLPREVTYKLTRDFMKQRARRYLTKAHNHSRAVTILLLVIFLIGVAGFALDHRAETHGLYWLAILAPALRFLFTGFEYWVLSRISQTQLNLQVVARIEAESLSIKTGDITTTIRWEAIKRLWKFSDLFSQLSHRFEG